MQSHQYGLDVLVFGVVLTLSCLTTEPREEGAKAAVKEMVNSVCRCQFEVTDSNTDEAVMNKLLQVLMCIASCNITHLLDEEDILEIAQACFRVGKDTRPTGK